MINSCSVCGNGNLVPCVEYGSVPLCDGYTPDKAAALSTPSFEIKVLNCSNCSHTEIAEKAPERLIYTNYKYYSSNSPDLDAHFTEYADWLRSRLSLKAGAVHIDVGCNDGLLLEKTQKVGFKTKGIDPSPAAGKAAEKGFEVYRDFLSEDLVGKNNLAGTADVITSNNTVANVRDLLGFGRAFSKMLRPGGYLVIETLHFPTLVQSLVFEMINHEHFHYFSVRSIETFFKRIGLELVSCERVATKGANMRCVARKPDPSTPLRQDAPKIDPRLAEPEASVDLKSFASVLEKTRALISSKIEEVGSKGPIVGFGAVCGTTILMYLLKLQNKVSFIVDDNPSRHGYYSPGSGLPVIGPDEYHKLKPSITILFAWRFAAPITQKHRAHLPPEHQFLLANTGLPSK